MCERVSKTEMQEKSINPRKSAEKFRRGKGFRINDAIKGGRGEANFEFASSNELWRALTF